MSGTEKKETVKSGETKAVAAEETKTHPYQVEEKLPSRGRFYDDAMPDGAITIRPITVDEEKIFMGRGSKLKVFDAILSKCILSPCVPMAEMLMADKFYLLLVLRSISYGTDYSFKITCPSCHTSFTHAVQLPKGLQIRIATKDDTEPYECVLPVSKKKLMLRYLRGRDEEDIESYAQNVGTTPGIEDIGDESYPYQLSKYIVTIDDEELDAIEKLDFCKAMIGGDSLALRRAIAEHELGIDFTIEAPCRSCSTTVSTSLPVTAEFFPSGVSR